MKAGQILYRGFFLQCVFVTTVCFQQAAPNQLAQSAMKIGSYDVEKNEKTAERVKKDGGLEQDRISEVKKLETNLQKLNRTLNYEIKWGKLTGALASAAFHLSAAKNLAYEHKVEVTIDPKKFGLENPSLLSDAIISVIKEWKGHYAVRIVNSNLVHKKTAKKIKSTLAHIRKNLVNGSRNNLVENFEDAAELATDNIQKLKKLLGLFHNVQLMIREVVAALPTFSAKAEIVDHLERFSIELDTSEQTWIHLVQMFQSVEISNKIGAILAEKLLGNSEKVQNPKAEIYLSKEEVVELKLYLMRASLEARLVAGRCMASLLYHKDRKSKVSEMISKLEDPFYKTHHYAAWRLDATESADLFEETQRKIIEKLIPLFLEDMVEYDKIMIKD